MNFEVTQSKQQQCSMSTELFNVEVNSFQLDETLSDGLAIKTPDTYTQSNYEKNTQQQSCFTKWRLLPCTDAPQEL